MFFLVIPFNIARVNLITLPYTISYLMFFLGWFFSLEKDLYLLFFTISFTTKSLLCFYLLPLIEILFINDFKNIKEIIKRNLITISLPFIYYFFSNKFLKHMLYMEITIRNSLWRILFISAIKQLLDFLVLKVDNIGFIPIIALIVFKLLNKYKYFGDGIIPKKTKNILFILGLSLTILAVFPYWVLGHVPMFYDWKSRHQILMPLGSSLIISAIVLQFRFSSRRIIFSLFLSLFIILNINNYIALNYDWNKQTQLVKLISDNKVINNSDLIVFEDLTYKQNAFSRKYTFYEWNSLLKEAFNDEKRLGINKDNNIKDLDFIAGLESSNCKEFYKMNDFSMKSKLKTTLVKIDYDNDGFFNLSSLQKIKTKAYSFFRPKFIFFISDFKTPLIKEKQTQYFCK